jgi:hypothetical protein
MVCSHVLILVQAYEMEPVENDRESPTGEVMRPPPPQPPTARKITESSIELTWKHVKENLQPNVLYKFRVQEANKDQTEWGTVYSGNSTKKVIKRLQPSTEYSYRLCYAAPDTDRSEYSDVYTVKTEGKVY